MPRKYDLGQRALSAAATRERILEATIALHAERGIVATSYKDVARRADVGLGTVYHHFPELADLVTACGGRLMETTRPPTPEVFRGLRSGRARLERLTAEVFAWYERYPHWRRGLCDADKLEALSRGVRRREAVLRAVIAAGLGSGASEETVALVRALLDYEVYHSLRDAGFPVASASRAVARALSSATRMTRR